MIMITATTHVFSADGFLLIDSVYIE